MYKFVYYKNIVYALSSFAGKTVKGIAKCNPADLYDKTYGEKLARVRCNKKIATKKIQNAQSKLAEAKRELRKAQKRVNDMEEYLVDALNMKSDAECEEAELLKQAY